MPTAQGLSPGVNYLKTKDFLEAKKTLSTVDRQPAEQQRVLTSYTLDNHLISKIYRELKKSSNREVKLTNNKKGRGTPKTVFKNNQTKSPEGQ